MKNLEGGGGFEVKTMSINGPIQILLHKSKEGWRSDPYIVIYFCYTQITGTFKTLSYLFHNYDATSLENIHSITF